jgi:DNA-binding IclR family transcriptional regulator
MFPSGTAAGWKSTIMTVKQAANVLDLIEFFARSKRPATLSQIAEAFGWPRSSTFNIIATLVERGFLYEPKARAGYYPTPRWLSLAQDIAEAEPLPASLHALLGHLAAETGETVHVAAQAGLSVVFLDVVESEAAVRYFARIGNRLPIQATATGRAILAQYAPPARRALLEKVQFERYQPATPMTVEQVEAEIDRGIDQGWFESATEFTPDVQGIAVSLPLADRRLALAVAGPVFRFGPRIGEVGALARDAVGRYLREFVESASAR